MKKKKYTVQDLIDEHDRQQMDLNSAGYENMGANMLIAFIILLIIFGAIIWIN